jgi:predicted nucleic acid-binding protein
LTLVVHASVALWASGAGTWKPLGSETLVEPALMWSDATSSLHEAVWRRAHRRLHATAWQIAEDMGWAKTYDAEYVALARLLDARVVTLDSRLRRGADRLGLVVLPEELRGARVTFGGTIATSVIAPPVDR